MARMAEEKSIKKNSDLYKKGISQFENNLIIVLSRLAEQKIQTMIATLPSNLLDQKPFYSFDEDNSNSADYLFQYGKDLMSKGEISKADSILRLAKDNDGLRFRAPSVFN